MLSALSSKDPPEYHLVVRPNDRAANGQIMLAVKFDRKGVSDFSLALFDSFEAAEMLESMQSPLNRTFLN